MKNVEQYYGNLHAENEEYSGAAYNTDHLIRSKPVAEWLSARRGTAIDMLDVGCGKGLFMKDFLERAADSCGVQSSQAVGIDLIASSDNVFDKSVGDFVFVKHNLEGEDLPFAVESFDLISCNHLLEHIFETEQLLREMQRVLKPGGLLIVSVPNLAAWVNRLLLLFSIQPVGAEVGTEAITYGFVGRAARRHLGQWKPAGHVRCFTPRALRDIVAACGFIPLGWWNQDPVALFRISKWAGRNVGLIAAKG